MLRMLPLILFYLSSTAVSLAAPPETHALRLTPGQDLRKSLQAFVRSQELQAAYVVTAVGSLNSVALRFANQKDGTVLKGPFEIVSLVGTSSEQGGSHFHIAVADSSGKTIGGHLLEGSPVYTTVELVLGNMPNVSFQRKHDPKTKYKELVIEAVN